MWHDRKPIVMAASSAALHFSCGATKKFDVMAKAEFLSGKHSWKEAKRRDSGRIQQAEHRAQEQHKRYRLTRPQAKQNLTGYHDSQNGERRYHDNKNGERR